MIVEDDEQPQGAISVVIVTWNHRDFLPTCLDALSAQTYPSFAVTVVDNGSQDGGAEWVQENAPGVRLLRLETNAGFSRAFNLGVQAVNSEFILSLNPDVCVRPDFLAKLMATMQQDPKIGIVAPKLLRADDNRYLDSTGLFINRQRRPYDRGQMQLDQGQFDEKRTEIFGGCGAAALYRRSMLEDLAIDHEYFDEDFFAYYEDADLAWRAKLYGWRCVFSPQAVGEHVRGWGDTLRKHTAKQGNGPRLALRNHFLMILKNDLSWDFLRDAASIFLAEIPRWGYMVLFRRDALKGIIDFFQLAPKAREKRQIIQANRIIAERDLRVWFHQHD